MLKRIVFTTTSNFFSLLHRLGQGRKMATLCCSPLCKENDTLFDQYVLPQHGISPQASKENKLSIIAGSLLYNSKPVQATKLESCLKSFLDYLTAFQSKVVLVAHNNKLFDSRILIKSYQKCNLFDELQSILDGFVDTLPVFQEISSR